MSIAEAALRIVLYTVVTLVLKFVISISKPDTGKYLLLEAISFNFSIILALCFFYKKDYFFCTVITHTGFTCLQYVLPKAPIRIFSILYILCLYPLELPVLKLYSCFTMFIHFCSQAIRLSESVYYKIYK